MTFVPIRNANYDSTTVVVIELIVFTENFVDDFAESTTPEVCRLLHPSNMMMNISPGSTKLFERHPGVDLAEPI
jgi:hypothetical protein